MPRLIDKDELKKAIQENICQVICDEPRGCSYCRVDDVWDVIYEQPTVDIDAITESHEQIGYDKGFRDGYAQATSEVRHGHWEVWFENEETRQVKCSECRMMFTVGKGRDGNYCPNCGAKMDEVEDGD